MSLTLFVIEDFEPKLSEEALLIEEFRILYSPAYNKGPGDTQGRNRYRAIKECKYIYHMFDYRSEFSEYDDKERQIEALTSADLALEYEISIELRNCCIIFQQLQETRMLKVLRTAEGALDKLRAYFDTVDFNEKDKNGNLVHKPKDLMAAIADLGVTNKKLKDLEKLVRNELKESVTLKGDHESGFDSAVE